MEIVRKMLQLQVLQHLLINYIKRKRMGDLQSKSIQNYELRHLQQQYEPFSKGKLMPGNPVYLKLNSIFNKSEYCEKINSRFKKLQRYQVSKRYSEASLQQDRHIYDYRRTNLPCIVQVVYYYIEKQDCECAADAARILLFTEHVETRLAHFKTSKKIQNNDLLSIQYYHSFSLDQGIYVLINALHAYQLLSQQFMVNYPSPFSIGITYRGQVKAWINDNWGLNDQNQRKLNESYLIEEIINIIEERMQGNFNQILNLTSNYMNFTFATIQELLSRYTLNYQHGKKSLQDRLNYRFFSKDADKSNIFSQKIPIGRHRPNSMHSITYNSNTLQFQTNSITVQDVTKSTQHQKMNEKRPLSQQNSKNSNPNFIANCSRNFSTTPKTSIQESPKKIIKFTYQQSPSIRQSPKISNYQRNSSPVCAFNQTIKVLSPPPTIYSYAVANKNKIQNLDMHPTKQSGKNRPLMMPFNVSADFFNKQTITNLIDMKIKLQNESNNKYSAIGRPIVNHGSYKQQTLTEIKTIQNSFEQNQICFDKFSRNITINPFEISAKQQKKVNFDSSLQTLIQKKNSIQFNKTSSENASLSSITQQFKNLLKSDHKIEERQELFYNYEQEQQSQNDKEFQKDCRKTVEQPYDNNPYVHSFYEIKQEDEDVSNSVDQHF